MLLMIQVVTMHSLGESLDFLSKLRTIEGKEHPCIYGWKISINVLFGLWQHLKIEEKFQFILTGRLNQDCVENLFSIIRGKGGFNDNPDVEQFKAAFKYLLAGKLFRVTQVIVSFDNDTILLNISNVVMAKYIKTGQTDVEKPQITDVVMVTAVPSSLPTKNVAAYLAGYLLSQIPVDTCQDCSNQLILPKLPSPYDELTVYEFLQYKTYQEAGCLVYLTPAMITFVDRLETLFCGICEGIIHMPPVLARLCKGTDDFCTFLKCKEVQCSLQLKSMVKVYMKVQIFHALKISNVQINQEKMGKCNGKMLKLSYL